ncbi:hypothetical protein J437_LFUL018974 [Ladona fulva]|uniref:Reverse transcriptase n=1 Tax=Ladona fulva TaxID=123851 RepID=A0A8K0KSY1_LADFU|nr:hypothetical protein J437_LFUL018974 [Ladona fulva]
MCKTLSKPMPPPAPILENNIWHSDPQTEANIFARYLRNIMTAAKNNPTTDTNIINTNINIEYTPANEPDTIHTAEILSHIQTLKNQKAPGHDHITNHMIKLAAKIPHFLTLLTDLFNACLHTSHFPNTWKTGIKCTSSITLNNTTIPKVTHHKFLGVTLTNNLSWYKHIKTTLAQASYRKHLLRPLFNNKQNITSKTKLRLAHTLITPIILYACPFTFNTTKTNIKK